MNRLRGWWRVAVALMLSALLIAPLPPAEVTRAAEVDDTSDRVGQVNALFLAGFYRVHDLDDFGDEDENDPVTSPEIVELSLINPNARSDNGNVDALVVVYNSQAAAIGCGIFKLIPNEITEPIDLDQLVNDSGGGSLSAPLESDDPLEPDGPPNKFGTVLVVVTSSGSDFIGTNNEGSPKKKKKKSSNGAAPERGVVAYLSQTDGANTLSQVRLQPFNLADSEAESIRTEIPDSSWCEGAGEFSSLSESSPTTVQSNVSPHEKKKKSKEKTRKAAKPRKARTSLITTNELMPNGLTTNGGDDGE